MENTQPFYKQIQNARRAAGLSQAELAKQAGCTQSAISMFEGGKPDKLAQETIEKVASLLGVEVPAEASESSTRPVAAIVAHGHHFCPNVECLSNLPYFVGSEVYLLPTGMAGEGKRCRFCGEIMEERCPHCGAAVHEFGGCCPACGEKLVPVPEGFIDDPLVWAKERAAALAAVRNVLVNQ